MEKRFIKIHQNKKNVLVKKFEQIFGGLFKILKNINKEFIIIFNIWLISVWLSKFIKLKDFFIILTYFTKNMFSNTYEEED